MKLKRWEIVLKYIVEDFIETAQPVGSKTLLKNHRLNYSSATIRNEMMELENMGYIEKLIHQAEEFLQSMDIDITLLN